MRESSGLMPRHIFQSEVRKLWIDGYVQTGILGEDEAFFGHVHIVKDARFCAGEYVGHMELTNGEDVIVKKHPCGTLNGSIIRRADDGRK